MASFPPLRRSAMIPEPITAANRKNAPSPSAATRRASGGGSGCIRVPGPTDLAQPRLQAQLVDAFQWKGEEQLDATLQRIEGVAEPLGLTIRTCIGRILDPPM